MPESEDSRTEYFFDKTEYHSIMAEALKTVPGIESEGEAPVQGSADPREEEKAKGDNRFFLLLVALYCAVILAVGYVAYFLTQT